MANRDVITFRWGVPGDFIAVEYNDNNLQIRRIHVNVSAGHEVRALVWDVDAGGDPLDPTTAFIDVTFTGPITDEFNVPGNRRLVEVTGDGDPYFDLPQNWRYQFIEKSI